MVAEACHGGAPPPLTVGVLHCMHAACMLHRGDVCTQVMLSLQFLASRCFRRALPSFAFVEANVTAEPRDTGILKADGTLAVS